MVKRTSNDSGKKHFKLRDSDESTYKERQEQSTGSIGDSIFKKGYDIHKTVQGENCIRILPRTWEEPRHFGYDVYVHGFVGVNRGSYLCLAKMKNKPCPICEAAQEAKAAGEPDEVVSKLVARRRVIYWVLNRNLQKGKKLWPELFNGSPTMDRDIAAATHTKRGRIFIHLPDKGRDVMFMKKGQLLNTEYYGYQLDTEPTPISTDADEQQAILDFIENNPIPELLVYQKPDYLKMVIEGAVEEKDEDLDEKEDEDNEDDSEEEEAREYKAKSKAKEEDEEDEEDVDDDDDEEEEEETERVALKKKKTKKLDDEDEIPF